MTHYTPLSQKPKNDPKVVYVNKVIIDQANNNELKVMAKKLEEEMTLRAAKAVSYKTQNNDYRYVVKDKELNKAIGKIADYIDLSADDYLIWDHYQDA